MKKKYKIKYMNNLGENCALFTKIIIILNIAYACLSVI